MRILIDVYLQSPSDIRTDLPNLGAWDKYGVAEELDFSLPQFGKENFVSAKSSAGKFGTSTDGAYSWRVRIPTQSEIVQLNLTTFPTVVFTDLDKGQPVAKLEGTPQGRGVIADLLRGVIGGTGPGVKMQTAALWLLGFLLLAKLKKTA